MPWEVALIKPDKEEKKEHYGWNARDDKKPMGLYLILILMCLVLAWVLSGTSH